MKKKARELIKQAEQRGGKYVPVKQQTKMIQASYENILKDNELIYHERVPDFKQLPVIERANFVQITAIKFPTSVGFIGSYILVK